MAKDSNAKLKKYTAKISKKVKMVTEKGKLERKIYYNYEIK
jgi:hypothetical protein